jgi:hypothetical protein
LRRLAETIFTEKSAIAKRDRQHAGRALPGLVGEASTKFAHVGEGDDN